MFLQSGTVLMKRGVVPAHIIYYLVLPEIAFELSYTALLQNVLLILLITLINILNQPYITVLSIPIYRIALPSTKFKTK